MIWNIILDPIFLKVPDPIQDTETETFRHSRCNDFLESYSNFCMQFFYLCVEEENSNNKFVGEKGFS